MSRARIAAAVALVTGAATLVLAAAIAVSEFPAACAAGLVVVAAVSAWYGVLRRGAARVAGLTSPRWHWPESWCCS